MITLYIILLWIAMSQWFQVPNKRHAETGAIGTVLIAAAILLMEVTK